MRHPSPPCSIITRSATAGASSISSKWLFQIQLRIRAESHERMLRWFGPIGFLRSLTRLGQLTSPERPACLPPVSHDLRRRRRPGRPLSRIESAPIDFCLSQWGVLRNEDEEVKRMRRVDGEWCCCPKGVARNGDVGADVRRD